MNIFLKLTEDHGRQKRAAAALGVSTSTFSDWTRGLKVPKKSSMNKLRQFGFSDKDILDSCFGIQDTQ